MGDHLVCGRWDLIAYVCNGVVIIQLRWFGFVHAELDELEVVMDEDLVAPEYADMDTEVTDEMMDKANDKRNKAMEALAGGVRGVNS